jgi:hypothetical protein
MLLGIKSKGSVVVSFNAKRDPFWTNNFGVG